MKRLNPETNNPFKKGDVREDGYVFRHYKLWALKKDGMFGETWYRPSKFKNHKIKFSERQKQKYEENPEKFKKRTKQYYQNNKALFNAKNAKRRAAKLDRMLCWGKLCHKKAIQIWYNRSQLASIFMGEPYEIDHIVPLQGKNVSGLHVPWNLQLLTKKENRKKRNHHVE